MTRAILEPVPPLLRRERLEAYAAFLAQRDGTPDFEQGTLSLREEQIAKFEASELRYGGSFDPVLFARHHQSYDPRLATPPAVLALLVFVKTNANEAYAVERVMRRLSMRAENLRTQIERIALLEERYHTRLLLSASTIFGVHVAKPARPVAFTRGIVAGIVDLPEAASRPLTLAGEIVGILTFLRLIAAVRRAFRDHPLVRDALEERVTEVLVDEVGHMSLNRLLARTGTFAALRAVLPVVALGTRGALPEGEALGVLPIPMREVGAFDIGSLPAEVRRRAFIA